MCNQSKRKKKEAHEGRKGNKGGIVKNQKDRHLKPVKE